MISSDIWYYNMIVYWEEESGEGMLAWALACILSSLLFPPLTKNLLFHCLVFSHMPDNCGLKALRPWAKINIPSLKLFLSDLRSQNWERPLISSSFVFVVQQCYETWSHKQILFTNLDFCLSFSKLFFFSFLFPLLQDSN